MIFIFAVALGLIFGSAMTALLARQAGGERWRSGRSHCQKCRHHLSARDLVPVVSYLILRGRCRYCRGAIGLSYPLIELATVGLFVFVVWFHLGANPGSLTEIVSSGIWITILRDLAIVFVLEQIFLFDLWYGLILDQITLPAVIIFFLWNLILGMSWQKMLIGLLIGAGFFLAQYLLSQGKWIGGGDIRLGGLMGVLLGWPKLLVALFLAYVVGGMFGGVLLAIKRKKWGSQIPFGTFLTIGTFISLFWGDRILRWYLGGGI